MVEGKDSRNRAKLRTDFTSRGARLFGFARTLGIGTML
jgi:hypothetical protein